MTHAVLANARTKVSGDVTLVVGQRVGRNLKGFRITMHSDVAQELQVICVATLDMLDKRRSMAYRDDLAFDPATEYLEVPATKVVAHKPVPKRSRRKQAEVAEPERVEVDAGAIAILDQASSLDELNSNALSRQSFLFYAAVVGNAPDQRIAFVDHWNPYKAALSGNILTSFGDRLRRIEGPLLVFERTFDMLVSADHDILVLDAKAFEAVFRDIDAMADRIPAWSAAAVDSLPVDAATDAIIRRVAARSSRVAKQLRGLFERGAFTGKIDLAKLGNEMKSRQLEVDRLIVHGQLHLEEADVPVVLKLIDEKLYQGWRTGTEWDVTTRARRT